jgi:hypothetical protein
MKKHLLLPVIMMAVLALQGCDNEDETRELNTEGAIASELSVVHLNDKQDILTTTHTIWVTGKMRKLIVHKDTIPSLGITKTTAENDEGNSKTIPVRKDYEFYVTVK